MSCNNNVVKIYESYGDLGYYKIIIIIIFLQIICKNCLIIEYDKY